jgi:exodeoxyribonuclease VII small subunit
MKKNITFEEAMTKLEDTVRKLEGGSMSLDDSLAAFEEAVTLVKICNEKLETAERRVRILVDNAGEITDRPFDGAEDEA